MTISDVARAVGVSHPVVSKVINGGKSNLRVSEERRRQIEEAAERLGYRTNVAARAMKTGRHHAFGLLSSQDGSTSALPFELLWGIQQRMGDLDLHMVMGQVRDTLLDDQRNLPKLLREWVVDGLLVSYRTEPPEALLAAIKETQLPAVWLNVKRQYDAVRPNDLQGGKLATEALLDRGHKRISFVLPCAESAIDGYHYSLRDRVDAYASCMRQAGLQPNFIDFDCGLGANDRAYQLLHSVLSTEDRPTALLSHVGSSYWSADFWALLTSVCHDLKIKIPGDLALIGFQYSKISVGRCEASRCRMLWPKVAAEAVDMFAEKVRLGGKPIPERLVDFDILPGDTLTPLST